MRIMWFTNIILPDAAQLFGLPATNYGGWMDSQLKSMALFFNKNLDFYVITASDKERCAKLGNITYATFKGPPSFVSFKQRVPDSIEQRIKAHVESFDPDIVHIHGTENYYVLLSAVALGRCPVLVSLQGIINGYYPFYNGGLSVSELKPFRNALRSVIGKKEIFTQQKEWRTKRASQEIFALQNNRYFAGRTEWDKAWVAALSPSARYFHLNEVMRPSFYIDNANNAKRNDHIIYCSAAGSYPLKGLHWLLRAIHFLLPKYPDIQLRVADASFLQRDYENIRSRFSENQYVRYLKRQIAELDLDKHVIALPQLNAENVLSELKTASIFCLPSLCENSPNSLAEAMLVGVPCIVSNVGGIPSMVEDYVTGILVPSSDPAILAAKIDRLFSDTVLSQKLAYNARAVALKRHDPRDVALKAIDIYETIIASRG